MKLEKMKKAVSGQYVPTKYAAQLWGTAKDFGMPEEFVDGVLFTVGFLTCPEDEELHGKSPEEFLSLFLDQSDEPPAEVMEAAKEIIEKLEEMGVKVDCAFVARSDH